MPNLKTLRKSHGRKTEDCLLSENFNKWAKSVQRFWYEKCGEHFVEVKKILGGIPRTKTEQVAKAKLGDVRNLVLPGGGDLTTRIWASLRVSIHSIRKWRTKEATHTSAFKAATNQIEAFAYEETEFYAHAWKIASTCEETQFKCEILFLMEALEQNNPLRP